MICGVMKAVCYVAWGAGKYYRVEWYGQFHVSRSCWCAGYHLCICAFACSFLKGRRMRGLRAVNVNLTTLPSFPPRPLTQCFVTFTRKRSGSFERAPSFLLLVFLFSSKALLRRTSQNLLSSNIFAHTHPRSNAFNNSSPHSDSIALQTLPARRTADE